MKLTVEEAYKSMVLFLEGFYKRTGSDDIAGLLGGMIFFDDGTTADPSAWNDWVEMLER